MHGVFSKTLQRSVERQELCREERIMILQGKKCYFLINFFCLFVSAASPHSSFPHFSDLGGELLCLVMIKGRGECLMLSGFSRYAKLVEKKTGRKGKESYKITFIS